MSSRCAGRAAGTIWCSPTLPGCPRGPRVAPDAWPSSALACGFFAEVPRVLSKWSGTRLEKVTEVSGV